MNEQLRAGVASVVDFVDHSERRRLAVVVGVSVCFVALFEFLANYGLFVVYLGLGIAVVLYTRPTAQQTVAAGGYVFGTLVLLLFGTELYLTVIRGSTESVTATAVRELWRVVVGTALLVVGLWLRRAEL